MKKNHRSFLYLLLVVCLSNVTLYSYSRAETFESAAVLVVPPAAPVVVSPIYYCVNSSVVQLTATPAPGAILVLYGTSANAGIPSSTAPTPSTTTVGQTKYYVCQSDSTGEGPRAAIVVNVVADNGGAILKLRCDPTQIAAADKNSSVFFDWANTVGLPNQYAYSYTVDSGAAVTGTTPLLIYKFAVYCQVRQLL